MGKKLDSSGQYTICSPNCSNASQPNLPRIKIISLLLLIVFRYLGITESSWLLVRSSNILMTSKLLISFSLYGNVWTVEQGTTESCRTIVLAWNGMDWTRSKRKHQD